MSISVLNRGASGGGLVPIINVTGVSEMDIVTCTKNGKNYPGKRVSVPNPAAHGLPDGYTELEYIESTGTQYIDTNIETSANLSVSIRFAPLVIPSTDSVIAPYGARVNNKNSALYVSIGTGSTSTISINIAHGTNSSNLSEVYTEITPKIEQFYEVINSSNGAYLDATKYSFPNGTTDTYPTALHIVLFARNVNNAIGNYFTGRISDFVIVKEDVELCNYVPCKRNSDSAIGMYDLVTNTFFGNSGSGTFIAGAEIPTYTGYMQFKVRDFGEYTIAANNGVNEVTKTVLVDAISEYTVEISYAL